MSSFLLRQFIFCSCLILSSLASAQSPEKNFAAMSCDELSEEIAELCGSGKFSESIPLAHLMVEKARRDSSESNAIQGNSLDMLGYVLHHSDIWAEAQTYLQAGVEHSRKYLGEQHEDYMTHLSNLAMLHLDMGENAKAVSELETTVRLAKQYLEQDNPYLPIMVNNLGLAYEQSGAFDQALEEYEQARQLTESTLGKNHLRYGLRLSNIAALYKKVGKPAPALELNLEAKKIVENAVGHNHYFYAVAISNLMNNYLLLNRNEEAAALSPELLEMLEKPAISHTADAFNLAAVMGQLYLATGQYERCAAYMQEQLDRCLQLYPRLYSRHTVLAEYAMKALEKSGRLEDAARLAIQNNGYSLLEIRENLIDFSEREQLQYYNTTLKWRHRSFMQFALRHPEFPELAAAAYNYEMTVKGISLMSRRQLFQSLRNNPDAQLNAQFEAWQALQKNISRQYALPPEKRIPHVDSLVARSNELERNLVLGSNMFRQASSATLWKDVRSALGPDEAAIELGMVDNISGDSTWYVAWVIRPGEANPRQVVLFEEKELRSMSAIRKLYSSESNPSEGKNLRELVWNPLQASLQGVKSLYFAPAGLLHQINFAAISVSDQQVVSDLMQVHRLISTNQVPDLKQATGVAVFPASALVMGGIFYDADNISQNTSSGMPDTTTFILRNRNGVPYADWDYLPGSYQEAKQVQDRLKKIGIDAVFVDGRNASEEMFKQAIQPAPSLLHLATHGFFIQTPVPGSANGFASADNPMARSGLALAGANHVWKGMAAPENKEDGILTALEISRLDLNGTELAVLSACGTGQGKMEGAEGVFGLQRAFKMAGVHYVIMTLWSIQDTHAQQFMDFFYDAWLQQKQNVPDAFRLAQHQMRLLYAKPNQPMAWAGFLLLE